VSVGAALVAEDHGVAGAPSELETVDAGDALPCRRIRSGGMRLPTQPEETRSKVVQLGLRAAANDGQSVSLARRQKVCISTEEDTRLCIGKFERDLETVRAQLETMQTQLVAAQAQNGRNNSEIALLKTDLEAEKAITVNLQVRDGTMNLCIVKVNNSLDEAVTQIVQQQTRIATLQNSLKIVRNESADLRVRVVEVQLQNEQKDAEIARLKADLRRATGNVSLAQIMIDNG
jgi:chromosome segregation ATPase